MLVTVGVSLTSINHKTFGIRGEGIDYSLTLDSTNKVTSAGDRDQYSARGGKVTFTYSNVANSTTGHVTLNNGGTVVNKDIIHSVTSIKAEFAGSLKARLGFVNNNWGEYFDLVSGKEYETGTNPYFVKFKSIANNTTISNIIFRYSCLVNDEAEIEESSGEYDIAFVAAGSDSSTEITSSSSLFEQVETGSSYISSFSNLSKLYAGKSGLKFGSSSATGSMIINFNTTNVEEQVSTIDFTTLRYGTDTGNFRVYVNGSNSYTDITPSEGGSVTVNNTLTSLKIVTTSKRAYLRGVTLNYGVTPDAPENPTKYVTGFSAVDANKDTYSTNSIFDNDNALVVKKLYSDSSQVTLDEGDYSYVIKNSLGDEINTAQAFGAEGTYTLIVSYKNYIPVEIQLTVGFHVVLTGIEVISTNTIFTTAQKLSDYTSGITANLTYNRESDNETGVAYSSFASKGISLTLINPSQVNYSITSLFGTAGTWTIKVTSNTNSSVYGTLNITVNAIPVTAISVTGSSATVEEESTLQLTASVTPNNATNQTVTWSSNHTSIATVNTNGLVTGVSAGEARITATANDGSTVYGYIDITVTAKPIQTEFDADMAAGTNSMSVTVNGNSGVKVGTSKAAGSMTITVGEGATKLSFYAAGWNGTSTVINLSGATFGTSSFSLTADSGISGSGSDYTLSGTESDYYFETTLSGINSETDITVSASTRFALWNAKYYTVQVDPVYPTSISLVGDTSVSIGGTLGLEVNYTPADTNVKNVSFSSNKTNIATVSAEGLVTGVAAGTARITATAEAESGTVSAYLDITVNAIAVSSVSLNKTSTSLTAGDTEQLTATISPSNATNKNVTWSTSNNAVATVSNGLVTAVAAGSATITVTTVDGSKKATCSVTVTAAAPVGEQTATYTFNNKSWGTTSTNWTSGQDGNAYTANQGIQVTSSASGANGTSPVSFAAVQSVVVSYCTNASKGAGSIAVKVGSTQIASKSVSTSGGTSPRDMTFDSDGSLSGNITITVTCTTNSIYINVCTITYGTATPTDPTAIIVDPTSVELAPGGTKNLGLTYTPASANQHKDVTWSRYSGSSNISVDSSGKVTVSSNASAGNTAVIRATLNYDNSIYSECTVTVVEQVNDDQTILLYICGSDLESNGQTSSSSAAGYASGDITEILKVSGQPDDVNIVIETGGAKCWKSTHGINKSYLERYHVANKSLVRDSQETKANMGLTSTLQSFLTWGVQTYPADRISLILWNHGGAMRGVCYDENYNSDSLTNYEVKTAVANTFTSLGRSTSDKFEWIGYDACLMQVQDIAEFNSQYFNYMIASEESEAGAGWDYDNWIDDAYAHKTTPNILKAIVDSFISEQGGTSSTSNDQTLSYLDLSYMAAYKSAWETMSSTINSMISSYGKTNFQTLMKTCKCYGSDSDCEGYSYFGILDAKDVMNKIKGTSAFSSASTQITNTLTAFTNLVAYSSCGRGAGQSYGLCCFFPMTDGSGYTCSTSSVYTSSQTNFTNWRSIVTSYGS